MSKLLQKGFTALELLLIILLIAIISGAGYYVFNQSKNDDSSKSQKSDSGQQADKKAEDSQKFLAITELGIKIPLSKGIDDAYYVVKPDVPAVAYLSLNSMKDTENCAADEVSLGAISKHVASDVNEQSGKTWGESAEGYGKVIGTSAYLFSSPQAFCSDTVGGEVEAKQTAAIAAFKEATKQLQAL